MFHSNPYVTLDTPTLRCTPDITLYTDTWHSILLYFTPTPIVHCAPPLYTVPTTLHYGPVLHCTPIYFTPTPIVHCAPPLYTVPTTLHYGPVLHCIPIYFTPTPTLYNTVVSVSEIQPHTVTKCVGWMSWDVVTLNGEIVEMVGKSVIFFFQSRNNERYRMAYREWRHNYSVRQWFLSLLLSFPLVWKLTLPASFNVNAESTKIASYNLWSWLFYFNSRL
jgi:hypothetical protein